MRLDAPPQLRSELRYRGHEARARAILLLEAMSDVAASIPYLVILPRYRLKSGLLGQRHKTSALCIGEEAMEREGFERQRRQLIAAAPSVGAERQQRGREREALDGVALVGAHVVPARMVCHGATCEFCASRAGPTDQTERSETRHRNRW